jgi:VIT1/CCC1 family predicted Fe2+/Mn2+ transporter
MSWLTVPAVLQLVVGLGLLNVWLVRSGSATAYRGGEARSLREEFAVYGLPTFAFYVVGGLKVASALVLIAGVWETLPVRLAASVIAALMVGALVMHVKVGDPAKKAVPASVMLVLSAAIILLTA